VEPVKPGEHEHVAVLKVDKQVPPFKQVIETVPSVLEQDCVPKFL
jgi:hypothetical protein